MKHYEMAFKHAPELADPKINPEVLSSRLQLGAQVRHFDSERFENEHAHAVPGAGGRAQSEAAIKRDAAAHRESGAGGGGPGDTGPGDPDAGACSRK